MIQMLHTFSDGSVLQKIKAKELIGIPVWKGNRFIDETHVKQIQNAIGNKIENLDSTIFRVVKYKDGETEQKYLVDGQHRQSILKNYFTENYILPLNFDILLIEKTVDSEAEAIEYFNAVNNTKPQQDSDPKLLANKYIQALEKKYKKLIRPEGKNTKRPFLSSDLLRKVLEENSTLLKQSDENVTIFIKKVDAWNNKKVNDYELGSLYVQSKDKTVLQNCIDKQFILAFDNKLSWIRECLI